MQPDIIGQRDGIYSFLKYTSNIIFFTLVFTFCLPGKDQYLESPVIGIEDRLPYHLRCESSRWALVLEQIIYGDSGQ
jgi:hypothetical protein